MDEKTPDEKKQKNETDFVLEPEHGEPDGTLNAAPEKKEIAGSNVQPEPDEETPAAENITPDPEPPTDEPQIDLEPPEPGTPTEEPQLDLEPPEPEPPAEEQTAASVSKKQETDEEIVVVTKLKPDGSKKKAPAGQKNNPERGISRRFDPRRTKVDENGKEIFAPQIAFDPRKTKANESGKEIFAPQIAFAKGIAQDGPPARTPADLLKNPKTMAGAAAAIVILAALLFFLLKPEPEPVPAPQPPSQKAAVQKKKAESPAPQKEPEKTAPVEKKPPEIVYRKYTDKAFSVSLPAGYKVMADPGSGLRKRFFLYGKKIKVQVLYWEQAGKWDAEEMMYNKIEKIQKTKNSANALRVNSYRLITLSNSRGYEIAMSGIRNYTYSRAKIYAFYAKGKMFLIDIDCKDSKNPDTLKLFNALTDAIKKTLHVHG